jgi:hypothetical protein
MPDEKKTSSSSKPPAPGDKKPYVKPNVTSEPLYETLALACAKHPGQGGVCTGAPHRS